MDKYKIIDMEDSLIYNPLQLYADLYNDTLADKKFNMYKYIDMDLNQHQLYCISDIHADTYRFWQFLYLNKFVLVDKIPEVSKIKWNPEMRNKALVICGDIIDGRRHPNQNLHASLNNEVLMHTIIYNLRLDAIQYNSYIFCTLGNHDFFAFHNGNVNNVPHHMYIDYMDSKTRENYNYIFSQIFHNYLEDEKSENVVSKILPNDIAYFARTFMLSRFYLIGFPVCLKINTILFAHAGFHKSENIFSLFDGGENSNTTIQPLLIHRNILERMSDLDFLFAFFEFLDRKNIVPTYADYYDYVFDLLIGQLHRKVADTALVDKYAEYFKLSSNNSIIDDLLLTRKLQKNCKEVDEILQIYGCKMLVVGHCPTCLGPDIFNPKNTNGITDCNDARIVFSCNSKLLTVDIAFSSGFTPMKEFLECLLIEKNLAGQFFVKVVRKILKPSKFMRLMTIEDNHHVYSPQHKSWIKYNPGNSSSNNSNSDDEYSSRTVQAKMLDDLFRENNEPLEEDEDDLGPRRPSIMDIFAEVKK